MSSQKKTYQLREQSKQLESDIRTIHSCITESSLLDYACGLMIQTVSGIVGIIVGYTAGSRQDRQTIIGYIQIKMGRRRCMLIIY